MSECVLCNKQMGKSTRALHVIDWDNLTILGQAHTGCVRKKVGDIRYFPLDLPSLERLQYAKRLRRVIEAFNNKNKGHIWDKYDFHKYMLANEVLFKISSNEEFLNYPRVLKLTDWWLNGSKIIFQEEFDDIFEWIRTLGDTEA